MSTKLNCWEFKNCGREKGGLMAATLGECPVAQAMKYDGMNDGSAAGRVCWRVAVSDMPNRPPRSCRADSCHRCDFYRRVQHEEESKLQCALATAVTR